MLSPKEVSLQKVWQESIKLQWIEAQRIFLSLCVWTPALVIAGTFHGFGLLKVAIKKQRLGNVAAKDPSLKLKSCVKCCIILYQQ